MDLLKQLADPDNKYRSIPFWSWNDKLDQDELRRQINAMHQAGIGGYFMHARGGLLTEYMGDEWFDCVRACIDEGRKLGMHSWAYDENGWPSGFGDGMVNGRGLDYQQKYLRFKEVPAGEDSPDHVIAYYEPGTCKMLADPAGDQDVVCAYFDVNKYYVDTLDGMVIDEFLEVIYEKYSDRLEGVDWSELAGFFTDEPQVSRNGIPWSFIYEESYKEHYGEDLLPLLPQLFLAEGDYQQTRYRFWRLTTTLFIKNFMKKIYDWCEEYGCKITGHHVCEESYGSQLTSNGAVMPNYQFYHIPGMDWLGRRINPVTTPVQVASVCAQTGKKQIMSETFAMCGWNVKFEDLKWMFQWQMVHGINLLCQHLESYSLKGIRKRDYPASLFLHQPWWKDYRLFNDYVTRIGVLLAEGEIKVDTLILHGQSTAWLCYDDSDNTKLDDYFKKFLSLSNMIDSTHVNFHYGDETMIDMHGSVENGKFIIGQQSYSLVVMPQMKNLSGPVFERLKEFVAQGGRVLAVKNGVEDVPCLLEGKTDSELDTMIEQFIWFDSEDALTAAIGEYTKIQPVVVAGTPAEERDAVVSQLSKINCCRRSFADLDGAPAEMLYFVNNDLDQGYAADIYIDGKSVERFNPADASFSSVSATDEDGVLKLYNCFEPAGDLILIVRDTVAETFVEPESVSGEFEPLDLDGEFKLEAMTDNVLTLDYCAYSFDGEKQSDREYVLSIHDHAISLRRPVEVAMSFKFFIGDDFDFSNELYLIIERPELFDIKINGGEVDNTSDGFFFDREFKKVSIKGMVKPGGNLVELNTTFKQPDSVYECIDAAACFESEKNKLSYEMELEAIYLAGQFGVQTQGDWQELEHEAERYSGEFALTVKPENVPCDAVQRAGLPFFSGELTISREFELFADDLAGRTLIYDRQMANVSRIKINGQELPPVLWKPFALKLDDLLVEGTNSIEITLTGSLRNMLGPHHLDDGESYGVSPASFYKDKGVFSRADIEWNENYCFVEFGIEGLRIS